MKEIYTVPFQPTEAQWGGLARDIMMWLRLSGSGRPTGESLYEHLEMTGKDAPKWLLDEVPRTDHVPPKGTLCAIIYKAMLADS